MAGLANNASCETGTLSEKRSNFPRSGTWNVWSVLLCTLAGSLALGLVGCGGAQENRRQHEESMPMNDFLVVAHGPEAKRRIGQYHYLRAGGNYPNAYINAVKSFGNPSGRGADNPQSSICTVRWRQIGLDMEFTTAKGKPCARTKLRRSLWFASTMYVRRWRTDLGLRVGDSTKRMRQLYPRARFRDIPPRPPYWSLIRERFPYPIGEIDALKAEAWGGHVVALSIPSNRI